ncbi:MAG: CoA transferase [Actinomycetota bacterium]|nr:CoA transferase [Actinomycetota bacterium]
MTAAEENTKPLRGIQVLTLAVNVPGPAAAARLRGMGATVVKVEPPEGDPLAQANPDWYEALVCGQKVIQLNLKETDDRDRLDELLAESDLLLTATRPAALARLGLSWPELHDRYPQLSQTAIVGYPAPKDDVPGHDLTYLAGFGLLDPPELPRTLLADLAGAERAVSASLASLLGRELGRGAGYAQVPLAEAAKFFAEPLRYGITAPGGELGGGLPNYNLYRTREGWLSVAALEPHFWQKLLDELDLKTADRKDLENIFLTRTAEAWEAWASERDLPLAAVREAPPTKE